MILTIEIGNSTITLGGVEGEEICFECRINTDRVKTSDTYCIDLKTLLEIYGIGLDTIEGVIIASVVPQVLNSVRTAIRKLLGKEPIVVGPGIKTGLDIRLENPSQMGAGLVAADVAALAEHKPPMIIIDMGTATTISVVDENQNFIGGMIMPGLMVSRDAMSAKAAQLPQISLEAPKKTIGRNTVDCMRSGIIYGTASTIDGAIRHIEEELGQSCTVVSTGGLSALVTPHCKRKVIQDSDLLLKGMMILYRKNQV